ncbi:MULTISPECIES: hypothetical protein [unclassified Methylobacterium]|uniref:hypothetical protein n=3 Tax=Methylobacterium TaxID=407 RepID=UPI000AE65FAA|nr:MULTISPECIES: hypothetical protein [unclassified Methylobacterium]
MSRPRQSEPQGQVMPTAAEESAALRDDWMHGGHLVLAADPDPSDHAAIHAWILDVIEGGGGDPDQDGIRDLIYHSLNFDIPFQATERVRQSLIATVRARLQAPASRQGR